MPVAITPPPPLTAAQQRLVADNLPLLHWWLERQVFRRCHTTEEDRAELTFRCQVRLMAAAQRYDPTRSKFATYAVWHIRSAVSEWRRWAGRRRQRQRGKTISLHLLVGADDWTATCAEPETPALDPLAALTLAELEQHCSRVMKPRQWQVFHLCVVDGWTLDAAGKMLRLSKERVRQIKGQALRLLRATPPPGYDEWHAMEEGVTR